MSDTSELLKQCVTEPRLVQSSDGGAHLALLLNCLFFKHGFVNAASDGVQPTSDWNTRLSNEWLFHYRRQGCRNKFSLHCALQPATGKMFVQAREDDADGNRPCLGLLLHKYIPDPAHCNQHMWPACFTQLGALENMLTTYVAKPLAKAAMTATEEDVLASVADKPHKDSDTWRKRYAVGLVLLLCAITARMHWK